MVDILPSILVAGAGDAAIPGGFVDGNGTDARFSSPTGMMMGNDGFTAFICDYGNNAIRTLNTRTLDVGTYASGSPLVFPMHLTVARSGNLYVSCAPNGNELGPVVKITTGGAMSVFSTAHQPRGIAVNADETVFYLMEQGHYYFTEIWRSYYATLDAGGTVTDHTNLGIFADAEGGCLAPDGYFYGVNAGTYYYALGGGFKRFDATGLLWKEAIAGDYGRERRSCAVRAGSDGRLWFYNVGNDRGQWAVYLTKIDLGGGIFSDEIMSDRTNKWGIAINNQDTVYFSDCGLYHDGLSIQGHVAHVYYRGVGAGVNAIYKIGCPPNPVATDSNHKTRLVVDDGVQTVRGKIKGAPELVITGDRDRCGRPLPAEMTAPKTRLRVRRP